MHLNDDRIALRNFFLSAGQEEHPVKKYRYAAKMRLLFIIPVLFGFTFLSMLSALKETSDITKFKTLISLWGGIAAVYISINIGSLLSKRTRLMLVFSYASIVAELLTNEIIIYMTGLVISHAFIFIVLSIALYRVFFDYCHSLVSVITSLTVHLVVMGGYMSGRLPLPPATKLMLWPEYTFQAVANFTIAVVLGIVLTFFVINLGMNQIYLLRQAVIENWSKDLACLERYSRAVAACSSA
ncbi:MAG: hypothetical protein N2376_08040 [Clostridia bacterium]|nr:hypothetical protein [Clostridia bacterium]